MDRNYEVITFISKYLYVRRPRVVNFADIIKIATIFIKTTFKDSNKIKRVKNYVLKVQSISAFLDITKVANFR